MRYTGANSLLGLANGRFDGHAHVFLSSLPMVTQRRYTPTYDATPETYFSLLRHHGLDGALLVQPSFLGSDNSYLLRVLAHGFGDQSLVLRAVVVINPGDPIDVTRFKEWDTLGVVGVRLNVFRNERYFRYADWQNVLGAVEKRGWHIELHCAGEFLPTILPQLTAKHAKVVIDHLGLVGDGRKGEGLRSILSQSRDQIWIKVSALYRNDPKAVQGDDLKRSEPLRRLYKEYFGRDRLVWGSDWPFTQYEQRVTFEDTLALTL